MEGTELVGIWQGDLLPWRRKGWTDSCPGSQADRRPTSAEPDLDAVSPNQISWNEWIKWKNE